MGEIRHTKEQVRKGDIMLKILDLVGDRALDIYDIFEGSLAAGYGASLGRLEYEHNKRSRKREEERFERDKRREDERRFNKYVWKLKRDGLITENNDGKISITPAGEKKRKSIKNVKRNLKIEESKNLIIISFDIPESYASRRNWLREVLKMLGFEMIHMSTWVGKTKIPKELIGVLEKYEILKYIKIFEVSKTGTLKEMK